MKILLSKRNIDLLHFIARSRFTTPHLATDYFYNARGITTPQGKAMNANTVSKLLARLCGTGEQENLLYLTRNAMSQKAGSGFNARPIGVYFFRRPNLLRLRDDLLKAGLADEWDRFSEFLDERKRTKHYAQQSLRHEVGISKCFLALDQAHHTQKPFDLFEFLFTSPNHPAFSQTLEVPKTVKKTGRQYIAQLPLNPDGFFFTTRGSRIDCFFVEYDTGTETKIEVVSQKYEAYYSYFKGQTRWLENVRTYLATQGIDLPKTITTVPFRVLFICESERRRNSLMIRSTDLPTKGLFWFATVDDFVTNPTAAIWINKGILGKDPLDYYRSNTDPKNPAKLTTPKLNAWVDDTISNSAKVMLWPPVSTTQKATEPA